METRGSTEAVVSDIIQKLVYRRCERSLLPPPPHEYCFNAIPIFTMGSDSDWLDRFYLLTDCLISVNRPFAQSGHMARNKLHWEQITQWDFQNKGKSGWTGTNPFVLEVPLRNLCPSVIYSVPCDRIVQRSYWICSCNVLLTVTFFTSRSIKPLRTAAVESVDSVCTGSIVLTRMTCAVINVFFQKRI